MTKPVRIQRLRKKGRNMQEASLAINGLPAIYVGRPTIYGNIYVCTKHGCELTPCNCCESYHCCVKNYREWLMSKIEERPIAKWAVSFAMICQSLEGDPIRLKIIENLPQLRNHNLACWCPLDKPCHADILLELANS